MLEMCYEYLLAFWLMYNIHIHINNSMPFYSPISCVHLEAIYTIILDTVSIRINEQHYVSDGKNLLTMMNKMQFTVRIRRIWICHLPRLLHWILNSFIFCFTNTSRWKYIRHIWNRTTFPYIQALQNDRHFAYQMWKCTLFNKNIFFKYRYICFSMAQLVLSQHWFR